LDEKAIQPSPGVGIGILGGVGVEVGVGVGVWVAVGVIGVKVGGTAVFGTGVYSLLSVIVTVTSATAIPLYPASALTTLCVMTAVCVPSTTESSTTETVTVCGVSQFSGVNVRVAGLTMT
jgi:hypothetical protein